MKRSMIIKLVIGLILFLLLSFGIFFYVMPPKISLKGDKEVVISVNSDYKEQGAIAKTNDKDVSKDIKIIGKVNSNKPGTYKIIYEVKENNMVSRVTRKVKVVDDVKPQITLINGEEINLCPKQEFIEPGYSAVDNYDGDITNKVIIENKGNEVIYKVKDSSNNEITIIRKINKIDKEVPQISLNGPASISLIIGSKYYEKGYNAVDNCDGDINSKVKINNNVNVDKVGTYTIKYEVTDNSGNINSVSRKVVIKNLPAPKNSTIYLTFDDGPSNITPKVLDILKEENVKATFFVLNRSDSYNYLLNRIVNEGHTIGLHGNTHDYHTAYASVESYLNDLSSISNKVKNVTGIDSKIMRFIGGSSNMVSQFNPGIMSALTQEVANRGYYYYDWNIGSIDTQDISSYQVYSNVTSMLGSKSTYVVLMHDYDGNNKTVNALRDIISYGKNNGYKFDRITESTPQIKHKINN